MPDRPNILWYCSDQQRFDTVGALNNPHIRTPRLDAFMRQAVTFSHAYCQSPICTPSRASFLTGMYPSALGVNGNGHARFPAHWQERLLPNRLAQAGYDCGLVGKLHLASPARGREARVADGYRYFHYSHDHKGPDVFGHDYAEWLRLKGEDPARLLKPYVTDTYREGAKVQSFGGLYEPAETADNVPPHLHQTHWCSEKAIEFMRLNRAAGQPWLLSVNPFDPHPPFDPPWEYYRRYSPEDLPGAHYRDGDLAQQQKLAAAGVDFQSDPRPAAEWDDRKVQAAYYAMIEQVDAEFGRLLDHLEESGQRDNTVVIFCSDHGETLGDHGLMLKGCRFYEGLTRVPLMVSWPGHIEGGRVSDALVELLDLAPTLYQAAGEDVPYWVQGRSLLPLLRGEEYQERQAVRCEFYGAIDFPDQTHATMYRDRRWKLVSYHGKEIDGRPLQELYDLEADPWEHCDLAGESACADALARLVQRSFDATVAALPPSSARTMPF